MDKHITTSGIRRGGFGQKKEQVQILQTKYELYKYEAVCSIPCIGQAFKLPPRDCNTYKDAISRRRELARAVSSRIFGVLLPRFGFGFGYGLKTEISSSARTRETRFVLKIIFR